MRIVGFNLTKIHAEKYSMLSTPALNNNISFTNLEKEKTDVLKDGQAVKLSFRYSLEYESQTEKKEKQAEVSFEGNTMLSVNKEELKEFDKSWKKKQVPQEYLEILFNFILKKCSAKAIPLQDEINIPSPYIKIPPIKIQNP